MEMNLKDMERRPYSYWGADGILDLVVGWVSFLIGGLWLVGLNLPRRPAVWIPFWIIAPIAFTALSLLQGRIVRRLKERTTDPRTGQIELRAPAGWTRAVGLGISLLFGAFVTYSVFSGQGLARLPMESIIGFGVPASLGLQFLLIGRHQRRFLILSGICLASTISGFLRGFRYSTLLWNLVAVGLALGIMGTIRLRSYLKAHPQAGASE